MTMEPLQARDPRRVGDYALFGRLGASTLGVVFLGRSSEGEMVTLTVLDDRWAADEQFRARFTAAVIAARAVSCPRTASVVDADLTAAHPWLAATYVQAPSLAELVAAEGPIAVDRLLPLAGALAEGLACVHAAGIVHRDLAPGQVLMASDGPRITGFGIAPPADLDLAVRAGGMSTTMAFLSPEQVGGQPPTPASDMFAFGGVLYLAATGEAPFGIGPASAVLTRIVRADCDLSRIPHPELAGLLATCFVTDPARRPSSVEVVDWVRRAAASPAASAAPVSPATPAASVTRTPATPAIPVTRTPATALPPQPPVARPRHTTVLRYLAAAVAAVLLIGAGVLAWTRLVSRSTPAAATTTIPTRPPTAVPATGDGSSGTQPEGAANGTPTTDAGPLTLATSRSVLSGHTNHALGVTLNAQGTWVATGGADSTARIWDAVTGAPVKTLTMPTEYWVMAVAFSPNGKLLATGSLDGSTRIWDLATGRITRTFPGHTGGAFAVAFSPNGKVLATAGKDRVARLWSVTSGRRMRVLSGHTGGLTGVAFSPDGALLATSSSDGTARLWNARTGKRIRALATTPRGLAAVTFSPDSRSLVAAGRDGLTRMWRVSSGTPTQVFSGHTEAVLAVAFSRDGAVLATAGEDRTARLWDAATGTPTATLAAHTSWVRGVALSSDGRTLATVSDDKTGRLWDLPAPTP
jgi:hypothetical protein